MELAYSVALVFWSLGVHASAGLRGMRSID